MKALLFHILPRIWSRLFILIIAAILLTWIVVAIAVYWLGNAQRVVSDLDARQVPRLTQTSKLSAKAADLAMLSNRILYMDRSDSAELEETLGDSVTELHRFIDESLSPVLTRGDTGEIQQNLTSVINTLARSQQIEARLHTKLERLRWLNVDVQDESTAIMADFNYNIEVMTRALIRQEAPETRQATADTLTREQTLRDAFATLSNDVSTAAALAIQISSSPSREQLQKLEQLASDALSRSNAVIARLPYKDEYVSLRQATNALGGLIIGRTGLVSDRKKWLATRAQLRGQLDVVFVHLSEIQGKLQQDAAEQRAALARTTASFSQNAMTSMRLLLVTTVLAAAGGLAILFLYIRPSIIRPMQSLTAAMREIASGDTPQLKDLPVRNDEIGQLAEAVEAFSVSVRERDTAIEELRQTQNELVQVGKMAALGNLSAGISHELNQPLGAIRQRLHLLRKAVVKGDAVKLHTQVEKIEDLVTRMERIISHLRRFARRSDYLREEVALLPVINSARDLLKAQFKERDISVKIDAALDRKTVIGDAVLLEQVLVNLLSNASDAIADTRRPGEILFRAEDAPEGQVAFTVADTGSGLGELDPERAIDPFVSTKDPGEGLGLGLSISYNIITGMGGKLRLAPRTGIGTRATVTLPAGGT